MDATPSSKSLSLDPASFDSLWVRAFAPPLVAGFAIAVTKGVFGFLLVGFHVWIHEFGHATLAWLTGHRALPLPIGWTNVEGARSDFVYLGVLLLLGLLAWTGVRERKPIAILVAVGLAILQFELTWRTSADMARKWMIFAGVGGEFYLSAAMIGLFYFRLPAKFKWGWCRYGFLFIGSSKLYDSFTFWLHVKHGSEGIPYGSMVGGEDDQGGDMNILFDDYHWTQHHIMDTYFHLGQACLMGLALLYVIFATGLDEWIGKGFAACLPASIRFRWEMGAGEDA